MKLRLPGVNKRN